MKLENVEGLPIAHPFVKGFDKQYYCVDTNESIQVSSGVVPPAVAARTKESVGELDNIIEAHVCCYYVGLAVTPKQKGACTISHLPTTLTSAQAFQARRNSISLTLLQNLQRCARCGTSSTRLLWASQSGTYAGLQQRSHANDLGVLLNLVFLSFSTALPDFVFENGERSAEPTKGKKRSKVRIQPLRQLRRKPLVRDLLLTISLFLSPFPLISFGAACHDLVS